MSSSKYVRDELAAKITQAVKQLIPSCVTCTHFDGTNEICNADPLKRRPPAVVIANGCPSFDDIPF